MLIHPAFRTFRTIVPVAAVVAALAMAAGTRAQGKKDVSVVAHKYAYKVDAGGPEIHVQQDDLVRITFSTEDIPHSFTMEDETYRVMRRADPGKPPVTFEFRADKAGKFPFQCTLRADDRCKDMHGTLVVEPRKTPR